MKILKQLFTIFIFFGLLSLMMIAAIKFDLLAGFGEKTNLPAFVSIAIIMLMPIVVIAVHELGHLIAGLWLGFRFELFVVGLLEVKREESGIKVGLNINLAYFGGIASTSPVGNDPANAIKFGKILLAGPLTSIIFALICFFLGYIAGGFFGSILNTGGLISIGIFLATTLPEKTGMFYTDRKRYQRLTQPGKARNEELALLAVLGSFSNDNSYSNVPLSDIHTMTESDDESIKYFGLFNLLCYQYEIEKGIQADSLYVYNNIATRMDKTLVKVFNKELDRWKQKVLNK